ncbi:MAG: hypothetical protein HRT47_11135 [Candidatus Caenarcaniphilales bacterium]|nr:hypothetical protein [Candidatus Caenarcaniphilales bacterium]
MFEEKRKKIFSNQLEPVSNKMIIGGLDQEEFLNLPTKDQILQDRMKEAEIEAQRHFNSVIEEAEAKAEAILAKAQAEEESIRTNAYNEGYAKGEADARQAVEDQYHNVLGEAAQIISSIEREKQEALDEEEEDVLDFIFLIAKKVIVKELSFDKSDMLELVKKSIRSLNFKQEILLTMPVDAARALQEYKDILHQEFPDLEMLTITADHELNPGDLIVESKKERLDVRLDSQIETLANDLKSIRKEEKLAAKGEETAAPVQAKAPAAPSTKVTPQTEAAPPSKPQQKAEEVNPENFDFDFENMDFSNLDMGEENDEN